MPFTLAHPAAALPLWAASKHRLRLAALVIGAATPDFEYFRYLNTVGGFAHSLPGLFAFCLPVGWLSLWLFDRYGRAGVQALLPAAWRLPPAPHDRYSLGPISLAILAGAASHVLWDAFTHASGWGVRTWPVLAQPISVATAALPWFRVLQHGSTLLGLAVLGIACLRWARHQPPVPRTELLRRIALPVGLLAVLGVANGLRFASNGFRQFVVAGGVAVTLGVGLGLVLLGAFTQGLRPRVPTS